MFRQQRGVTFIGWLFLLIPLAIVGYVAIRLVPIYLNYMRVAHSLDQTATEMKVEEGATLTPVLIRANIAKHFDIEDMAAAHEIAPHGFDSRFGRGVRVSLR